VLFFVILALKHIFQNSVVLYGVKDFEKLGFSEGDLARLWLAFSRLRSDEEAW